MVTPRDPHIECPGVLLMKTPIISSLFLTLLTIVLATGLLTACSESTSPPPAPADPVPVTGLLTADRHSFVFLAPWSFSPDLMYAAGYYTSIARITPESTVLQSEGNFAIYWDI
jgi:hypothetical protein